jgi:EAL domain-containing protein (putative c-di-GMP-specific phosphodiesterase class I)/FixJ family two-component response regulator
VQNTTEEPNVFIVDDDPFQIALFTRQLSRHGLSEVQSFIIGADALAHITCHGGDYPLLFLDLNMPEMDGVEFVRKLVETKYAGALALVSGEDARVIDTVARLASAHQLDVVGFLNKPVKNDALDAVIDHWRTHLSRRTKGPLKVYGAEEIRQALARNETVNYYQPKVRLDDATFYGVEALVRWQHPEDGLVFPDQFIASAEEHGLIEELTTVVLVQAIEQYQTWISEGLDISVAVNISMENLNRLEFPNVVQEHLNRLNVPPEALVLEITESRLTQDMTRQLDILARLRLKRISLSIDDFGTGHSSLAQLRDLPFTELKIDRSFVHGATSNATQGAIVEGNLYMAAQLGMTVVAEGIEDETDWNFLRSRKCNYGQGYYIAKPMPACDVFTWAQEWKNRWQELGLV